MAFRAAVASLIKHLGRNDPVRVTKADIRSWRDALLTGDRTAKTVNDSYITHIRTLYRLGKREDLDGDFVDTSRDGFALAMDVSAYSLVALAHGARPYLREGSSILTLTYYGAEKVVANYNVMGVAKAALEACVRYLAADLGPHGVRVNAISAGPIRTLAAAGIAGFKDLYRDFDQVAPLRAHIAIEDVGKSAVYLASDLSSAVTGEVLYVDGGFNVMGVPTGGS